MFKPLLTEVNREKEDTST